MTDKPYLILTQSKENVNVLQTTCGDVMSDVQTPYGGFNLGLHVKDTPLQVHSNRCKLLQYIQIDNPHIQRIHWLNQVHGNDVYHVTDNLKSELISADAHITTCHHVALAIMTADCVPIVLASNNGEVLGAIHAGWQGLAKGIIYRTVQKMAHQMTMQNNDVPLDELAIVTQGWQAWIGACIAPEHYEIDERVKQGVLSQMLVNQALETQFFQPVSEKSGHYLANLAKIAEYQLQQCGITHVTQSGLDSFADKRFYSYRRKHENKQAFTGRMATLIFKSSSN